MATSGFFTFHDLYAGKPEYYYQQNDFQPSSSTTMELELLSDPFDILLSSTTDISLSSADDISLSNVADISFSNTDDISFLNTTDVLQSVSSATIKSSNKFYELIQLIPFAYFHWFLIGLAILFTLLLAIIFTCYCRGHCKKNKKSRKEKKQPFPNFYRYRPSNRHAHATSIDETVTPHSFSSTSTRSTASKSNDGFNKQLLRQGLDAVGSPQIPRIDISEIGSSGTYSGSASDLISEIKTRLNNRPSNTLSKKERPYETQRANMALKNESKNGSMLLDLN